MILLSNLDLRKNQALNMVLQSLATAPSDPKEGQMYYNSVDKRAYIYTGNKWTALDAKDATMTSDDVINIINKGSSQINSEKINGLDAAIINKTNTTLEQAKEYARTEIGKVVGGATQAYDTLKEIEDLMKQQDLKVALIDNMTNKPDKYTVDIGDDRKTEFNIQHNLNSKDIVVQIRENNSPFSLVLADVKIVDVNNAKIIFAETPRTNEFRVVVIG